MKHVHDNVHGNIFLKPLSLEFADTEQFQRLCDLKQIGLAHMVYPGAVRSRYDIEHTLRAYWLADEVDVQATVGLTGTWDASRIFYCTRRLRKTIISLMATASAAMAVGYPVIAFGFLRILYVGSILIGFYAAV